LTDTVIYLVGDQNSPKTNSWLHMTNSEAKAKELVSAIPNGVVKEQPVKPPKRRKNKGGQK